MERVKELKLNNGSRIVNDLSSRLNQQKLSMGKSWDHTPWASDSWQDSHRP